MPIKDAKDKPTKEELNEAMATTFILMLTSMMLQLKLEVPFDSLSKEHHELVQMVCRSTFEYRDDIATIMDEDMLKKMGEIFEWKSVEENKKFLMSVADEIVDAASRGDAVYIKRDFDESTPEQLKEVMEQSGGEGVVVIDAKGATRLKANNDKLN